MVANYGIICHHRKWVLLTNYSTTLLRKYKVFLEKLDLIYASLWSVFTNFSLMLLLESFCFYTKKLSLDINSTTTNIFVRRYMQFVTDITVTFGFIPYACNILCKYGLHCFVSNALISCSSMPSQYCWKARVKNLVLTNEYDKWHDRIMTDEDFCLFRTLQPLISFCIAYDIFDNKLKNVTINIAKLWTYMYVPRNPEETCPYCNRTVCNPSTFCCKMFLLQSSA